MEVSEIRCEIISSKRLIASTIRVILSLTLHKGSTGDLVRFTQLEVT